MGYSLTLFSTPSPRPNGERVGVRGYESEIKAPPHPDPYIWLCADSGNSWQNLCAFASWRLCVKNGNVGAGINARRNGRHSNRRDYGWERTLPHRCHRHRRRRRKWKTSSPVCWNRSADISCRSSRPSGPGFRYRVRTFHNEIRRWAWLKNNRCTAKLKCVPSCSGLVRRSFRSPVSSFILGALGDLVVKEFFLSLFCFCSFRSALPAPCLDHFLTSDFRPPTSVFFLAPLTPSPWSPPASSQTVSWP